MMMMTIFSVKSSIPACSRRGIPGPKFPPKFIFGFSQKEVTEAWWWALERLYMAGGRIGRSTSREAAVRGHERLFDSRALGNSQLTMTLFRSRHHHVRFVTTSSHRRHNATQLLTKPANIRLDYRTACFIPVIACQHTDARYWYSNSVCPSVCPSRSGIVLKRLNMSS